MAESAKRHEENSNIIKEIRASTDAAIRYQGASIKVLEIQIGQMSKVLQERGFESLTSSTETNLSDHVKSISTAKVDSTRIRHIGSGPYVVSDSQISNIFSETVTFPMRLRDYCCNEWKEACELNIMETYSIAFVDLGARVSVMPFSTYTNLGLGDLAHTRLTIELADRTIKHPGGIAENVLVRIGKFISPIDFIIFDIPEDDDVPLILGRPFLSTAHAKIYVFKRKITLRVGEEKIVIKNIKLATSIIRRVYMLRTNLDSKTKLIGEAVNESFDPHYGDYIEVNNLDKPLEPRMNQDNEFEPTINEGIIINEPTNKCYKMKFSFMIGYKHVIANFIPILSINVMTKRFYNSIIKDKDDHGGKDLDGTLIDMPIFVGNFSIILGFTIIDDMDVTSDVVLGMLFCKKFVSSQKIMEKFARRDECERLKEE
ncbi:ribonuclease H-like domain-containing protein [Tanacetum coccineum]